MTVQHTAGLSTLLQTMGVNLAHRHLSMQYSPNDGTAHTAGLSTLPQPKGVSLAHISHVKKHTMLRIYLFIYLMHIAQSTVHSQLRVFTKLSLTEVENKYKTRTFYKRKI